MSHKIKHVIVLMMENRSFDHMLGFLDHPDPAFPRLTNQSNPAVGPVDPPIVVTPTAKPALPVDPDHSHRAWRPGESSVRVSSRADR